MKHKKLFSFLFAAVFWASSILPTSAANFSDMQKVPWAGAATYINQVADAGLMVGDTDLTTGQKVFRPVDPVTYCETVQLAYKLLSSYYGIASVSATAETSYASFLSTYNIPSWARPACLYCLDKNVITTADLSYFMQNPTTGISNNAQRQRVALIFGRAMANIVPTSANPSLSFKDAASISPEIVPYLEVLVRLGIINGDAVGNFNPGNNINRSEMAVIVSKTHEYLSTVSGGSITGTISSITNSGSDKQLTIVSSSETKTLTGNDTTPCIQGSSKISLSNLAVGDMVMASYKGSSLSSVLLLSSGGSVSDASTVSGLFVGMNNSVINVESNNKTVAYTMASDISFQLGGSTVNLNTMIGSAEYGDKVTLTLNANREVVKAVVAFKNDNYDVKGYYDTISSSAISLKKSKSSSSSSKYKFADSDYNNVDFYVDGNLSTFSKFKSEVSSGDTVQLLYDKNDEVIQVVLQGSDYDVEGYYVSISDSCMTIKKSKSSSSSDKYYFKDEDSDNVDFYIDDKSKTYSAFKSGVSSNDKIGLVLNKDDEIIEAYVLSDDKEYDEEGFFAAIADTYISIKESKSDSSGEKYYFSGKDSENVDFYVDDSSTTYSKFKNAVNKDDKIGLVLDRDDQVTTIYLLDDDYDVDGYFYQVEESYIKITSSKSSTTTKKYAFEDEDYDNVSFYIDGVSKSYSKFESDADDGDKIGLVLNKDDEVIKVYLTTSDEEYDKEGYFYSLDKDYIRLTASKSSTSSTKYYFEDEDYDRVDFYVDGSSKSYSSFESAAREGDKVGLVLNSKDEVIEVRLTSSGENDYDKTGYFYSIEDKYLRLKSSKSSSSSTKYYFEDEDYDNVKFYIDGSSSTYSKFKSNAEEDDKVGIDMNSDDEVTKVYLLD